MIVNNDFLVGAGEYCTAYVENGLAYGVLWQGNTNKYTQYNNVSNIVGIMGGQYQCLVWTKNGEAYELPNGSANARKLPTPTGGVIFGNMQNQSFLFVNNVGDLYYLAENAGRDSLQFGVSTTPKLLLGGKRVTKVEPGEEWQGMLVLTESGEVYKFNRGNIIPTKVNAPRIVDIAVVGRGAFVLNTGSDLLAWGPQAGWVGGKYGETNPTSVLSAWKGIQFPLKKMVGNWNTLHIIDAKGDMYGSGDNTMGEVGNGIGKPDWKNAKEWGTNKLTPYAWNWIAGQIVQAPVQIPGKWKNIFTSNSLTFFLFAIGADNKLYSWGRNKNRSLGNLRAAADTEVMSVFPNWEDVWAPIEANPKGTWVISPWNKDTAPNAYILPNPLPIPVEATTTSTTTTTTKAPTTTTSTTTTTTKALTTSTTTTTTVAPRRVVEITLKYNDGFTETITR